MSNLLNNKDKAVSNKLKKALKKSITFIKILLMLLILVLLFMLIWFLKNEAKVDVFIVVFGIALVSIFELLTMSVIILLVIIEMLKRHDN